MTPSPAFRNQRAPHHNPDARVHCNFCRTLNPRTRNLNPTTRHHKRIYLLEAQRHDFKQHLRSSQQLNSSSSTEHQIYTGSNVSTSNARDSIPDPDTPHPYNLLARFIHSLPTLVIQDEKPHNTPDPQNSKSRVSSLRRHPSILLVRIDQDSFVVDSPPGCQVSRCVAFGALLPIPGIEIEYPVLLGTHDTPLSDDDDSDDSVPKSHPPGLCSKTPF